MRFILIIIVATLVPWTSTAADLAGRVTRTKGSATALAEGGERRLAPGQYVFTGDVLSTGPEARLEVRLRDDSVLTLGEKSRLAVGDLDLPDAGNRGALVLDVIGGIFSAASGIIARRGGTMDVRTPVATIGIRGTTAWGGPIDGVYQFALLDGRRIDIANDAGRVSITTPGHGTTVPGPDVAPTPPTAWRQPKLDLARDSVAFDRP